MKKIASLLLTVVTVAALAGCGNSGNTNASGSGSSGNSDRRPSTSVGYPDEDGYAEGSLNDTMHSYFFDFAITSAYLCDEYGEYVADEGYEFLVADITIKNTTTETITMFDTDFQVHWNGNSADAYDAPITYYLKSTETIGDEVLPTEYDLTARESRSGLLVFTVPKGYENDEFSISYLELFDDGTDEGLEGDVFFVWFVPEVK